MQLFIQMAYITQGGFQKRTISSIFKIDVANFYIVSEMLEKQ